MRIDNLITGVAGIAVFAAILEIFTGEAEGGLGFRAVCGLAIMAVVMENLIKALGI